jgi:hypothetical protein
MLLGKAHPSRNFNAGGGCPSRFVKIKINNMMVEKNETETNT